jgi:hypothetical protein
MLPYEIVQHTYLDPWTYVRIREKMKIGNQVISLMGEGFARRRAIDPPDERVGLELALTRAREHVRQRRKAMKNRTNI